MIPEYPAISWVTITQTMADCHIQEERTRLPAPSKIEIEGRRSSNGSFAERRDLKAVSDLPFYNETLPRCSATAKGIFRADQWIQVHIEIIWPGTCRILEQPLTAYSQSGLGITNEVVPV